MPSSSSSSMSLRSLWTLCVDIAAGILLGTVASVTPVRTLRAAWVMMRGIELFLLAFLVFKVWWLNDSTLLAVRSQVDKPDVASHSLLDDYVVGAVRDYDFGQLDHFHRLWIAHFVVMVSLHLSTGLVLLPLLASVLLFKHITLHPVVRAHLLEQPVSRPWAGSPVPPNPRNKASWLAVLGVFESAPSANGNSAECTGDAPASGHAGFASASAGSASHAAMLSLCLEQVASELSALGARVAGRKGDIEAGDHVHTALSDAQAALGAAALALASNNADDLSPALVAASARLVRDLEVARAAAQPPQGWISLRACNKADAPRPELYLARPALHAAVYADEKAPVAVAVAYDEKASQATLEA